MHQVGEDIGVGLQNVEGPVHLLRVLVRGLVRKRLPKQALLQVVKVHRLICYDFSTYSFGQVRLDPALTIEVSLDLPLTQGLLLIYNLLLIALFRFVCAFSVLLDL